MQDTLLERPITAPDGLPLMGQPAIAEPLPSGLPRRVPMAPVPGAESAMDSLAKQGRKINDSRGPAVLSLVRHTIGMNERAGLDPEDRITILRGQVPEHLAGLVAAAEAEDPGFKVGSYLLAKALPAGIRPELRGRQPWSPTRRRIGTLGETALVTDGQIVHIPAIDDSRVGEPGRVVDAEFTRVRIVAPGKPRTRFPSATFYANDRPKPTGQQNIRPETPRSAPRPATVRSHRAPGLSDRVMHTISAAAKLIKSSEGSHRTRPYPGRHRR